MLRMAAGLRAIAFLLSAGCVLTWSLPTLAQLQPSRCPRAHPLKLWYTPAQGPQILTRIETVTFEGDIHLPVPDQEQIAESLRKRNDWSDAGLSELREFVSQYIRVAWQEHGYFKVKVRQLEADVLTSSPEQQVAAVTLYIEEGPLYRLSDITFKHVTVFPQEQVRALFPTQSGDVFNTDKVRIGLDALRSLYGTRGYINFTSVPDTQIDEVNRRISLVVDVDQGRQFRVSSTRVLGLNESLAHTLLEKWPMRQGDLYNNSLGGAFFKENSALLPPGANPEDQLARKIDLQQGTVALILDFRSCFVTVR
jgi:Surface antigen variable number repeat